VKRHAPCGGCRGTTRPAQPRQRGHAGWQSSGFMRFVARCGLPVRLARLRGHARLRTRVIASAAPLERGSPGGKGRRVRVRLRRARNARLGSQGPRSAAAGHLAALGAGTALGQGASRVRRSGCGSGVKDQQRAERIGQPLRSAKTVAVQRDHDPGDGLGRSVDECADRPLVILEPRDRSGPRACVAVGLLEPCCNHISVVTSARGECAIDQPQHSGRALAERVRALGRKLGGRPRESTRASSASTHLALGRVEVRDDSAENLRCGVEGD
jgi:hypothetical protein